MIELPPLAPAQFCAFSWQCPYLKGSLCPKGDYCLPSTGDWLHEELFATLYMGWNELGLSVFVSARGRTGADSVELFFDTRDAKTKIYASKFCHQFLFTPDEQNGTHGREITRFRGDDIHRLADPHDLSVAVESDDTSYTLTVHIPAASLHGYDPHQFPRLGFTYRISRAGAPAQHFSASSEEFAIDQYPSLWATIHLEGSG